MIGGMAHPYGDTLARNIRAMRARADLGQDVVAARMRALGFDWQRQTVGATEKPTRRVTGEELLGLALALETTLPRLLSPDPDDGALELPDGFLSVQTVQALAVGVNDHTVTWDGDKPVISEGTRLAPGLADIVRSVSAGRLAGG